MLEEKSEELERLEKENEELDKLVSELRVSFEKVGSDAFKTQTENKELKDDMEYWKDKFVTLS